MQPAGFAQGEKTDLVHIRYKTELSSTNPSSELTIVKHSSDNSVCIRAYNHACITSQCRLYNRFFVDSRCLKFWGRRFRRVARSRAEGEVAGSSNTKRNYVEVG